MQIYPAALLKLSLPAVLMCAAFFARTYIDQLGAESRAIVDNLPYLLCLVAVFTANQFNRCRLMLAALGIGAFYWAVQGYLQVSLSDPVAARAYVAMSMVLPVLGFYLLLLPERGIWSFYGLAFTVVFIVLGAVCLQLGPWLAQAGETAASYYAPRPFQGYVLSLGATLLVGFVVLVGIILLCLRNAEAEAALLGAFVALYGSLALLHLQYMSTVMCSAAGLCVMWGLLRSSHTMAYRDELTGLPGRRALNERMMMLGNRFTIAMLDIDHFKRFNDSYGHDVGDEVLRLVASRIARVGGGGTAYRYGGEEFCIVFPRKGVDDCVEPLEGVREAIANYAMSLRDRNLRPVRSQHGVKRRGATRLNSSSVSVTVSIGIAERSDSFADADAVITGADAQLYRAKKAGRNRLAY